MRELLRASRGLGLALLAVALLLGCAAGNKHRYESVSAKLDVPAGGRIAVSTLDQRPYVLSGDKPPHFVGLQRAGFGNPFAVGTRSGQPLAVDMTNAITSALKAQGAEASAVIPAPNESEGDVRKRLMESGARRLLLLKLREWKSDTYNRTSLEYDVQLQVLDDQGGELASSALQGDDNLGGSFWNPAAHAKRAVQSAFAAKVGMLFADPEVQQALR